jgi:hypothetical protein
MVPLLMERIIHNLTSGHILKLKLHTRSPTHITKFMSIAHNLDNLISIIAIRPRIELSRLVAESADVALLKVAILNFASLAVAEFDVGVLVIE